EIELLPVTTEADFLQKLMSEDGENRELAYTIPHSVSDIQEYSEPTEDHTQELLPTEPDNTPDQIDPPAQLTSAPQPARKVAQKRASQIRRSLKISSKKQRERHKKQNYNQYKRKPKRRK